MTLNIKHLVVSVCCFGLLSLGYAKVTIGAQLKVAVASNFAPTLKVLASQFEAQTTHQVLISSGSTGKLYAQIMNGAPYDVFLAADTLRPQKLIEQGLVANLKAHTYAYGMLALWQADLPVTYPDQHQSSHQAHFIERLQHGHFSYLSMANPKVAPYGSAALAVLKRLSLTNMLKGKVVRGENISQAFQFVESGNAQLGFVALSQLLKSAKDTSSYWILPQHFYPPIEQQLVILNSSSHANQFVSFLNTPSVKQTIERAGYGVKHE